MDSSSVRSDLKFRQSVWSNLAKDFEPEKSLACFRRVWVEIFERRSIFGCGLEGESFGLELNTVFVEMV
jgi:hypothetical protein